MTTFTLLGIAVSLAMDAFSVSIASGAKIRTPGPGHYFRLAFHFGLFQFFMPLIGYFSGVLVQSFIQKYDHWIALILLSIIGGKMFWESCQLDDSQEGIKDPSRGRTLILLSFATSIDAAAIGFSFAALGQPILWPSVLIGLICLGFSALGVYLGSRIGKILGVWAERFGGLVLIGIGVKILIEHLAV